MPIAKPEQRDKTARPGRLAVRQGSEQEIACGQGMGAGQVDLEIGLLVAVIIVVRVLPKGFSGFVLRERT